MTLNVLSLFSGIGGLELGLERAGMNVVGQVELDDYCRRVLAKHWPDVPRHDDVRTAADWWLSIERPTVDVICGGFPCQDISVAGKRAGIIDGEQSSLWTFFAHTVRLLRPRYVLVENVPRVLVRGNDGVIQAEVIAADLATLGYDLRWDCVPAAALGARHRRDRWFGIAHSQREQLRVEPVTKRGCSGTSVAAIDGPERHLADTDRAGLEGHGVRRPATERRAGTRDMANAARERLREGRPRRPAGDGADWAAVWPQALAHTDLERGRTSGPEGAGQAGADDLARSTGERRGIHTWAVEPRVGRVVNGIPTALDRATENARIHALGNAVVPQVSEHVGRLIVEHDRAVRAA